MSHEERTNQLRNLVVQLLPFGVNEKVASEIEFAISGACLAKRTTRTALLIRPHNAQLTMRTNLFETLKSHGHEGAFKAFAERKPDDSELLVVAWRDSSASPHLSFLDIGEARRELRPASRYYPPIPSRKL